MKQKAQRISMDISDYRREYMSQGLHREALNEDPLIVEQEPILLARTLVFEFVEFEGPLDESVRVGGAPYWLQDPEEYRCCCGGEMTFVAQISEFFRFPKQPAAPQELARGRMVCWICEQVLPWAFWKDV